MKRTTPAVGRGVRRAVIVAVVATCAAAACKTAPDTPLRLDTAPTPSPPFPVAWPCVQNAPSAARAASMVITVETCNGYDDDGDGCTDEPFAVGSPCDGLGTCGAGATECAGTYVTRCSTEPEGSRNESVPERCDGRDNDCDGDTDEGCR